MTWYIIGNANIDATKFLGTTNNQSLVIKINSASDPSEKMRVNPDGNVGIGRVPAPDTAYRLDVAGIINATDIHKNGSSVVGSQWSNVAGGLSYTGGNVSIREGVLRWGNSIANPDSIELGAPDGTTARIGTPFIDFHYLGRIEDFNTRIINDANGRLSIIAPILNISNNANVQGNLHVTGAATKPGGGWWTASSDARLKKSVAPLKSALDKLLRLRGVRVSSGRSPKSRGT